MTRKDLRPCLLLGERHYFHRWFEEGGFDRYPNDTMEGYIGVYALLEDANGNIKRISDITDIKFDVC
jgi:hypothetical protein